MAYFEGIQILVQNNAKKCDSIMAACGFYITWDTCSNQTLKLQLLNFRVLSSSELSDVNKR